MLFSFHLLIDYFNEENYPFNKIKKNIKKEIVGKFVATLIASDYSG